MSAAAQLQVGCKVNVLKIIDNDSFWRKSEVLALRTTTAGEVELYVHYINFNKRLDEWVPVARADLNTIEAPPDDHHKDPRDKTAAATKKKKKADALATDKKLPVVVASAGGTADERAGTPASMDIDHHAGTYALGLSLTVLPCSNA